MNDPHPHNSEKKRRKPRPEAWPLRPGDLPEPRVVGAEPRLAGMADNAVFRLAIFRRRGKLGLPLSTNQVSVLIVLAIWIGFGTLGIQVAAMRWLVWVIGPLGSIGGLIWAGRASLASPRRLARDFGLIPRDYEDLRSAGVDAETAVAGLWGAAVSHRRWRRARWVCLGLAAGVLALGLTPAVRYSVFVRIAWYGALYYAALWRARMGGVPWVQLGGVCGGIYSAAGHPFDKRDPLRVIFGAIIEVMFAALAPFFIAEAVFTPPVWWAMALLGGGSAMGLGWLRGRFIAREARLAASRWHRDAVRYMDALLHPFEIWLFGETRMAAVPAPITDPMLDPAPPPLPRR